MTDKEQSVTSPEIETKERILAAALKIFGEKGYHPATMAEIAEEANVGKGTLYWYFSSKEELFSGIIEQMIQTINLELRSVLEANEQPFPDLLLVFTKVFLDYSHKKRQLSRSSRGPLGFSDEPGSECSIGTVSFFRLTPNSSSRVYRRVFSNRRWKWNEW